jgi:hypothetical protein
MPVSPKLARWLLYAQQRHSSNSGQRRWSLAIQHRHSTTNG